MKAELTGTTVFFDFETGGTEDRHPNAQVAAVAVSSSWEELEAFERKIRFDPAACDPEALQVFGYSPERWEGAAEEADVARELTAFLGRHADLELVSKRGRPYKTCRLAGHNVSTFDVPRLRRAMDAALGGAYWPGCWWYPLDTLQLAFWGFALGRHGAPPENYRLQTLARHFGVAPCGPAHDALADVRVCVGVARALLA